MLNREAGPSKEPGKSVSASLLAGILAGVVVLGLAAYFGLVLLRRLEEMETKVSQLSQQTAESDERSERALERALQAESAAREAALGRSRAESEAEQAQKKTARARERLEGAEADAENAREEARAAREEADRLKQEWEAEVNRLYDALNQIVETRKTALGLVLNLSEDYLKFDFDKATLRPENRELLSRIAGILLTSKDYSISVFGHTDDIGTEEYNQRLSERRAQTVRDYLVKAGIDPNIITTQGLGESQPLVAAKTPEARVKNRRVEIGIVNTRIQYGEHGRP